MIENIDGSFALDGLEGVSIVGCGLALDSLNASRLLLSAMSVMANSVESGKSTSTSLECVVSAKLLILCSDWMLVP